MLALVGLALAVASLIDPLALLADDSWFYLVIGRNVADGHGITFSRVGGTNGFQPLWGAVVSATIALAHLVGVDSVLGEARAILLVGWGLLGLALWRLDRLLRRLQVPPAGIGLACLSVLAYLGGLLGTLASEANLHLLLVVLVAERCLDLGQQEAPSARASVATGCLLGLMVLGRLDSGFVAASALAVLLGFGRAPWRSRLRSVGIAAVVAALVTAPYFAWNVLRFGRLMPIAGAIKVDAGHLGIDPEAVGSTGFVLLVFILVAGAVSFIGRRPSRFEVLVVVPAVIGGAVSMGVYLLAGVGRFTDLDWYRMPHLFAAAVLAGLAVARLEEAWPRTVDLAVVVVGVVLVMAPLFVVFERRLAGANHEYWHPVADFSVAVGAAVPPEEVIATLDFPGVLAAFSQRHVVALDGLTGDYDFQNDLVESGGACALAQRGVQWLTVDDGDRLRRLDGSIPVDGDEPPFTVVISSWLHRVDVGVVELDPGALVLEDRASGLSLWRIDPRCP